MITFNKIQVIKILRDQISGLSLKEAKDIVDGYAMKSFEEKVVSALGEDSRWDLMNWARLFVASENKMYNRPNVPDSVPVIRECDPVLERLLADDDEVEGSYDPILARLLAKEDEAEDPYSRATDSYYCCEDCDGA